MSQKRLFLTLLLAVLSSGVLAGPEVRSPYTIVEQAPAADWRQLDPENTLYIDLLSGTVVVELLEDIAPRNSANFKQLVRQGFYDGLSVYRVVDGFVAQAGDIEGTRDTGGAQRELPGEFVSVKNLPHVFTPLGGVDGFADETGFVNGFALGRAGRFQWLLHCPGAFALARGDAPDSGGTEFYTVLGQAPRYLDRNVTVFGAVRHGMEHYQKLNRGPDASGQLSPERRNPIERIRLAADVPALQRLPLQVMRTESGSFKELMRSRASRPEAWFVYQPAYVDICGVPVPVRLGKS